HPAGPLVEIHIEVQEDIDELLHDFHMSDSCSSLHPERGKNSRLAEITAISTGKRARWPASETGSQNRQTLYRSIISGPGKPLPQPPAGCRSGSALRPPPDRGAASGRLAGEQRACGCADRPPQRLCRASAAGGIPGPVR